MTYKRQRKANSTFNYGRVAVIMGGISTERDVSLQSGQGIYNALKEQGIDVVMIDVQDDCIAQLQAENIDRAFIALHGGYGEDGSIQAVLDFLGIPYTGAGHSASALCMDKIRSKCVWKSLGLPVLPTVHCTKGQAITETINFPVAVKPNRHGSTVGIRRVDTHAELAEALEYAYQFDDEIFLEPWIEGGEYTVGLLAGGRLPSIKIEAKDNFYDYEAKYLSDETVFLCPSNLTAEEEAQIGKLAEQAFAVLGGTGWGRIDFMRDEQGNFWLLEANTVPGLTSHSLVPIAAQAIGLSYAEMALEILHESVQEPFAIERQPEVL